MSGLEKFKVPIIIVALLAVGAAVFAIMKSGGADATTTSVDKAAEVVTSGNQPNSEPIPDNLKTGMTLGEKK